MLNLTFTKIPFLHFLSQLFTLFALAVYTLTVEGQDPPIAILSQSRSELPDGSYKSEFETANGIKEEVEVKIKVINETTSIPVVKGHVSWVAPDGSLQEFSYTADENGYKAEGPILPVAPEIPRAIAQALEYIRLHPEAEPKPE